MNKMLQAQDAVGARMDEILAIFKPGAKITVIVRRPGAHDQDFMMTDDDPAEVIGLINRRITAK